MILVERYILREWLKLLGIILGAIIGLLLVQSMYDDLSELLEDHATIKDLLIYYAIKLPSYLSVVLPLGILVSLLYVLGNFHRNNEITSMRAAGMSIFQITRSIWIAGIVLCGLMWLVNAYVIPWSVETSRDIRQNIEFRFEAKGNTPADRIGLKQTVAFDNNRYRRMWFFNRYSQNTERGYGATVIELDTKGREKTRILAREAYRDREKGHWVFLDGREIWVDPDLNIAIRTEPFTEKRMPTYTEDTALMLSFDIKPQDLSFSELDTIVNYFTLEQNPKVTRYAVRYYSLLFDTLSPLIIIAIAIPFSISGVRTNPVVGVSKSIGLFLLYFLLMKICNALGSRNVISPMWAGLLPNLSMLAVGIYLFRKIR